jgi:tetratricopeptide (TPR) repeat protein
MEDRRGSQSLYEEARRRLDAGDPRSALSLAETVLATARESGRPEQVGPAAQLLGECHLVVGDIAAAWPLAQEALRVDEARGDAASIGMDLNLMGVLQITAGQLDEAMRTLRRSYDLRAEALGAEHEDAIESLNNLAVALWRSGRQEEAIGLHEEALRRCERALGEAHRRTAETLNALAVKASALPENNERSRDLYSRALASAEQALGPDTELVARLLANLGIAHLNLEEPAKARPLLERAAELHDRHFGPMSRWTAYVLDAVGNLAVAEGRNVDARAAFERALVIRVKEQGPTDGETVETALGLMGALSELAAEDEEIMAEATALYLPIIALRPDLATSLMGGGPADPEAAGEQLRTIANRISARRTPDSGQLDARARAQALLGEVDAFFLDGELGAAGDRLREAIGLLETAFGAGSTELVEPLRRLRLVLRLAGTESEVLPILERITAILAGAYGDAHPLAVRALGEQYWQELREYGLAGGRGTAQRIRELTQRTLGEANPLVLLVAEAIDRAREGLPPDARPDAERLSVRRERFVSTPNPLADELLVDLGAVEWRALDHAYGKALDSPLHLRILLSDDERLRLDGLGLLTESVLHQGSVYPATAPVIRFVRRLVTDRRVPGRADLIVLLAAAQGAAGEGAAADEGLAAELGDVPGMLSRLAASDPDPRVREAAVQALQDIGSGPVN